MRERAHERRTQPADRRAIERIGAGDAAHAIGSEEARVRGAI
jgi:hypothetical protein